MINWLICLYWAYWLSIPWSYYYRFWSKLATNISIKQSTSSISQVESHVTTASTVLLQLQLFWPLNILLSLQSERDYITSLNLNISLITPSVERVPIVWEMKWFALHVAFVGESRLRMSETSWSNETWSTITITGMTSCNESYLFMHGPRSKLLQISTLISTCSFCDLRTTYRLQYHSIWLIHCLIDWG